MKYDIVADLSKDIATKFTDENMYINYAEQHYLTIISEKLKVDNYKKIGDGIFEFNLKNGIKFYLAFDKNGSKHFMSLYSKIIKDNIDDYGNIEVKAVFNLKSYRRFTRLVVEHNMIEECKFNISIKLEEGYHNIEGEIYNKDSSDAGELRFLYYDNESIEYYKFRNNLAEFNYPDSSQLAKNGIIPDSVSTKIYKTEQELFEIFITCLANQNEFLKQIFETIKNQTTPTK